MACSIIRNKQTNEIEQVLASNGKESQLYQQILKVNPDKEAALRMWAQVYTPSFKAWFGDWEKGEGSKVVDNNGEPLLVYHGSKITSDIRQFNSGVTYTTTDYDYALKNFAFGRKENVYPLFVKMDNPLDGDKEGKTIMDLPEEIALKSKDFIAPRFIKEWLGKNFDGVYGTDSFGKAADISKGKVYVAFEPNQIKSLYNQGTFSQDTGNIYYQLTSKETEEANKQLNTYLSDFLKPFGVQVRDFEEYKKRTGQDGLGTTDVLNKLIYLSSQAKIDTMPEEAAHMAIMLMGEKHPDINYLLDNIEYWSEYQGIKKEYSEKYKGNQKMIKLEAIAKLISGSIVNKYKETGGDKKLIEKALAFINSFFQKIREMFLKKNAFYNPMGYGVHLADKIAINMLAGNTNYIANLENSKKALSYDEALENNSFAKSIIDRYTKGRYNFKLVGSLAIAGQGENIYRPSEEPIHDLDFIVSNIEDYNDLVNHMSDIGAERVHNGWANKSKGYTTYAYYIPAPGHRIDVISRDRRGWVSEYKLFDPNGKEVKPNANNIMATDFFVYYDKSFEESIGIFSSWQDIYNGKLGLSRAEGAERLFQREKDQRDYVLSQPVNRERQLEEFTYLQKEKQSERPSNEELDRKIKRFLATIGVSASVVDEIRDREGNLIDAVAKADMLNKIVEVLNGTGDITTLPEEAAHFFVEMLGEGHPLYRQMAEKITSYAIYKDTVDKYKDDNLYRNPDGTINFNKLKKEAMGKLIMQHIIQQFDEDETVKRVEAARSWWKKVWDYIKSIFNKGEKVNEKLDNPFAIVAKKILTSDATDLDMQFKSDQEYLQKSTTAEEAFKKAKDLYNRITLDDSIDPVTGKNKHVYVKDGKPVVDADGTARSVNENVVKPWYKRRFPTDKRTDIQKVIDDLKAEFGTGLHKVIEKILDRYIDKDTGLVRDKAIAGEKLNVNAEVEKKLNTYIAGLVRSYPTGARFLAEARIFNEKKNLPGTVDLIVFLPDGSADIYDWKSQEVMDGETELKWFKEPAYRLQLEEYRQAIEEQFGITKFNKIRAIPIRTMFQMSKLKEAWVPQDLKDIEIGPVDPALVPESKEYLLPVVAEKESTGDKDLDKLISRLNIIHETLANKSSKDRDKKNIELNKIKKTIRNLQVKKDIKHFTESGLLEIDKYYDKLINNNIGISEILEARDIINVYNEGADYLESLLIKLNKSIDVEQDINKKNELLSLQDKFKTMILRAGSLVNRLEKRGRELADEEASKNGIKGLLNPERVMDYLKRNFRALSQLETTAAQAFYKIRNKAFQVRDAETEDMNENLAKLKDDLEKWASANGIPKDKIFDGILETDKNGKRTGDFLDMYSDKFRELKKEAIKRGDVAWIRANTVFDNEAYVAAFKRYQELVEGSVYSADPKLDREKKDAAILRWIETHNGEKSDTAALLPKGNFLRPKDIWWSDKYKALNKKENAPLKAVYDQFQSMLRDSEKAGMIDYEFGFIPSIIKTKMEAFVLGDMGKTGDKSSFLQSLAVDSSVDFGQLDINGKQVKKIPVYYTNDLGADKSFDLFKVFSIWGTHTSNYKAMSSIEDTANLLLFVEQNKQSLQTNRFGKVKKGAEPVNDNKVNAEVLENFINYYVYGQKLDAADDFSFKVGGTEISATRGMQKLLRYFSIKTLALNPISGTANLVGGTANASFVAKKNLYFGDKDWAWGQYKLASRDEKAMAFLDYTQVELENQAFHNSNQLSMSDVMKNWTSDKFFIIQRTGDKLVTYPVALAMFRTHMVDKDGKIVSIRDYVKAKNNYEGIYNLPSSERKKILEQIDKEIEELTESSSLYTKSKKVNGKLEIEGVDRKSDTFIEFRNKIKKMNKSIIGNSSQEDINQFRIGMLGQMVMQFRSWIPGLVTERFGDLAYDTDLETYNYGKARVFFKHFVDQKFLPLLGELVTGFGDNAIDRAKARYAELIIRKREQGDMNFEERMSETQFIDMYIANLRSMTREMLVMLAFLCLVLWAHTVPPDEDKEHNGARKLMAKAMDKYYNEVAFFYNPTEFQSLIKSPIPITGLFTDIAHFGQHTIKEVWGLGTGNEDLVKKSHPMKYFNKMIPVAKQAQDIFALFDKEFRTNWGIKT